MEFSCEVHGDPAPTIIWRREEGNIPTGRAQIQDDKSLKIRKVTLSDEGVYVCEAEVGTTWDAYVYGWGKAGVYERLRVTARV